MTPGDHQDLTAGRTGGVGAQPRLDAGHVEGVTALRKHEDLLARAELGQADRALRGGEFCGGLGGEGELREGLEDILLEAFVGQSSRRSRRRRRRGRSGGSAGGEAAEPGAASYRYEA